MAVAQQDMDAKPAKGSSLPIGQRKIKFSHLHGRVVSSLKLILPTIALALTIAVVAWPILEEHTSGPTTSGPDIRTFAQEVQINGATYAGQGDSDSPFTLTADNAVQPDPERLFFELTNPKGDVFWSNQDWYAITAPTGIYNQETGTLELSGGVNAFQDKGYEFQTESMVIDMAGRSGYGLEPIIGQGPDVYLSGEGFRVYNMGERVEIMGKSKLIIRSATTGS